MKIETYEVEETSSEIATLAADGEAMELIDKLNLVGQLELANTKTSTRFAYRRMTKLEMLVYRLHCPVTTEISKYKSSIIPIRILQVAAHASEFIPSLLHHVEIWHPEDARLDPVLVGCTGQYSGDLYLLARWGEVWKDFEQLVVEAKAMWIANKTAKLKKVEREVADSIASLAIDAEKAFTTGREESYAYYAS